MLFVNPILASAGLDRGPRSRFDPLFWAKPRLQCFGYAETEDEILLARLRANDPTAREAIRYKFMYLAETAGTKKCKPVRLANDIQAAPNLGIAVVRLLEAIDRCKTNKVQGGWLKAYLAKSVKHMRGEAARTDKGIVKVPLRQHARQAQKFQEGKTSISHLPQTITGAYDLDTFNGEDIEVPEHHSRGGS